MQGVGKHYYRREYAHPAKIAPLYGKAIRLRRLLIDDPISRNRYKAEPPALDETQRLVLQSLRETGIAMVAASQIFSGEMSLISQLQETLLKYRGSQYVKEETRKFLSRPGGNRKDYTIDWILNGEPVTFEHPLLQVGVSHRLLDIANSYLGFYSALRRADMVLTLPEAGSASRTASQNWHRDPEGRTLLKVFYFATDVDENSGPFEYITHSRPGEMNASLGGAVLGRYVTPEEEKRIESLPGSNMIARGIVPKGTFVLCDTFGLHRGGYTKGNLRLHALFMYVRQSCPFFRRYNLTDDPSEKIDVAQRTALFG